MEKFLQVPCKRGLYFLIKSHTRKHFLPLILFLFILSGFQAFADGSKNLYPAAGNGRRAYLLSTSTVAQFNPFATNGVLKAYVKAGDTIYTGSSAQGMLGTNTLGSGGAWNSQCARIVIRNPAGVEVANSGTSTTIGRINSWAEEQAGPIGTGHYTPFKYTAPMDGIYEIEFLSQGTGTNLYAATHNNNGKVYTGYEFPVADSFWVQPIERGASALIASWDVSIGRNGTLIPGRVYSNVFSATLPNNFPVNGGFYGKLYVLTDVGYTYLIDNNGQNGASFNFFSNNKGVFDSNGNPTYQSLTYSTSDITSITNKVHDPRNADANNNVTHKIFYTKPALDLPQKARYFRATDSTWLKIDALTPEITNLRIVGVEGTLNQVGKNGANITFNSNIAGRYYISVDANNNGNYNDSRDVHLEGYGQAGINQIFWNGKDGLGASPNPGLTTVSAKAQIFTAEVHFPFVDVEINPLGIKILLTHDDGTFDTIPGKDLVYWNDTISAVTVTGGGSTYTRSNPISTNGIGMSSNINGHKWGRQGQSTAGSGNSGTGGNDYGNERLLDTWTYITSPEVNTTATIAIMVADLEVKTISRTTPLPVSPGSTVTYSVVVSNNRNTNSADPNYSVSNVTGSTFSFKVPGGFTINPNDVSYIVNTGTIDTTISTTPVFTINPLTGEGIYTIKLDMTSGSQATFTISGSVADSLAGKNLLVEARIMRPADVTDPNATAAYAPNSPSDPTVECNAFPITCNNIKNTTDAVSAAISISGNVWRDANGNATSDGAETGTNAGGLYANLTNAAGKVVQSVVINSSGQYSFGNVQKNTSYHIVLTTAHQNDSTLISSATLPNNWVNTGVNLSGVANTSNKTGLINITTGTQAAQNQNFGIEQRPTADTLNVTSQMNPGGNLTVTVPRLTGSDPEDGEYDGTNGNYTVVISTLPTNGTLYYNGSPVTLNQVISNYKPDSLKLDPNDGSITVSFGFKTQDNAGVLSPEATANIPFNAMSISGNVWTDANGNATSDGAETGTNAGGLYANLTNAAGKVVQSVSVNASGNFSFPNVVSNTNYNIVLTIAHQNDSTLLSTSTLPNNWVSTGVNLSGVANTSNKTGIVALTTSNQSVQNQNFGIEQKPTADTLTATSQVNPGGNLTVTVPRLTGSDPEDGEYDGTNGNYTVVISNLPTNGTLYYNGSPVTLNQVISNYKPDSLKLDPNDGNITVSFGFKTQDKAGVLSPEATANIPFNAMSISGNVWTDANGNATSDGAETGTNAGGLYANLTNAAGKVVQSVSVNASGNFSFPNVVSNTNYNIVLTIAHQNDSTLLSTSTLPNNWVSTGVNLSGVANTSNKTGIVALTTSNQSVQNQNFGIEQKPAADTLTATSQVNPGGNLTVTVPRLTGSDPEDGEYDGTNGNYTVVISNLPTNGTLYYNGSPVTLNQVISNYKPDSLKLDPNDGSITVSFGFKTQDKAGVLSPEANVNIPFTAMSITGNVWTDANGNATSDGAETGTNAGGLYANLTNAAGKVVQSVSVNASGNFSFPNVVSNTNYNIVLTTTHQNDSTLLSTSTLPNNWVSTGVNLSGVANTSNKTGIVAITTSNQSVQNQNFGIEQKPTADTLNVTSQVNPGGNLTVTVPRLTGSDPEDGEYDGTNGNYTVVISTLPTNGTLYYNGSPVTLNQVISNYKPDSLKLDPNDGSITVSFGFKTQDKAGVLSPEANVNIPLTAMSISGNVWTDANGNATSDGAETGTNAGGLYANLTNAAGKVVQSVSVNGSGNFSFPNVVFNTNYNIVLTTAHQNDSTLLSTSTLPNNWVSTGVNLSGVSNTSNKTGIVTITTSNQSVQNQNFGIEQKPAADTLTAASQVNPGGNLTVTVPRLTGSDPEDGEYDGTNGNYTVVISNLPTNGTLYYNGSPVTLNQVISNYKPDSLKLDPNDGSITVSFGFKTQDKAGVLSPEANVNMPFTAVSITGKVWDDANGDAISNGLETGTNAGGLYANLIDSQNKVVQSVSVGGTGEFNFANVIINTSYKIILSAAYHNSGSSLTTSDLPDNWVNTGVNKTGTPNTGNKTGILTLTTGNQSVGDQNFGIEQVPNSDPKTHYLEKEVFTKAPPAGYEDFELIKEFRCIAGNNSNFIHGSMSGNDPEDCPAPSTTCATGSTFKIEGIYDGTKLFYKSGGFVDELLPGSVVQNFDPANLLIYGFEGSTSLGFDYTIFDRAGVESQPSVYQIILGSPLPVVLLNFNARAEGNVVRLEWATASELDNRGFVVERSANGKEFSEVTFISSLSATGNSTSKLNYLTYDNQPLNGKNIYRLKQLDKSGSFHYSILREVNIAKDPKAVTLYPNPVSEMITIETEGITEVKVYDILGNLVKSATPEKAEKVTMDVNTLPTGAYMIHITAGNETIVRKLMIRH